MSSIFQVLTVLALFSPVMIPSVVTVEESNWTKYLHDDFRDDEDGKKLNFVQPENGVEKTQHQFELVTSVPTSSPRTIRNNSPGTVRSKTRSGKSFSRHITMAVASITARRSASTFSKVNFS